MCIRAAKVDSVCIYPKTPGAPSLDLRCPQTPDVGFEAREDIDTLHACMHDRGSSDGTGRMCAGDLELICDAC